MANTQPTEYTAEEDFIREVQRFLGVAITGTMNESTRSAWLDLARNHPRYRRLFEAVAEVEELQP